MGYHTDFEGQFDLDRPLALEHKNYLKAFSEVRHMTWNAELLEQMEDDPIREAVGLPIGEDGRYFTGSIAIRRRAVKHPALDSLTLNHGFPYAGYIFPPPGVPSLWCQWEPNPEGTAIRWDGVEKFHGYIGWLRFLLEHFLIPWGYTLNGQIHWRGEQEGDNGIITVTNNEIATEEITNQDQ